MKLREILVGIEGLKVRGDLDIEITHLDKDSRNIKENGLFIAIKGFEEDGHEYIETAIKQGATCVILEEGVNNELVKKIPTQITVVVAKNTRYALAICSCNFYGNPSKRFKLIGITGTKGKTTTTFMIKKILEKSGKKVGLIGTIATYIGDKKLEDSDRTTPESNKLQEIFAKMVEEGIDTVVMEVSSQGLKLHRTAGIEFDYGMFTNLSPDHIGPNEHESFEEYLYCKSLLFKQCKQGIANMDDSHYEEIVANATCPIETYGVNDGASLKASNIELTRDIDYLGVDFDLEGLMNFRVHVGIPGSFSVYNALGAIAIVRHFGVSEEVINDVLKNMKVKGRVQIVPTGDDYTLIIDYAHNAVSLESILKTMRAYNPPRLVCMFGCGGNRAKSRRYEMGEVSGNMADLTIITSDNPRFEEPQDIINDIITGIEKTDGKYIEIIDRREAISYCMKNAHPGDIVVLAGKGHETYQEIKGVKYHMSEEETVMELLQEMK